MRAIRMQREAAERQRSIDLVSRLQRGQSTPARSVIDERTLKYNTGYMPKRWAHRMGRALAEVQCSNILKFCFL